VKAASLLEVAKGRDAPRLVGQRGEGSGMAIAPPPVAVQGLQGRRQLLHIVQGHLGVPLLPADCAGRPCPLCGKPVDIFGDHAVACKKSGFGDRHLGTQSFFYQVLTQARIPHDREVEVGGNGRRQADVLLGAWDVRRDLAVDLTILQPNPATGRPLRGSAATFLKDKGEQKNQESADSCGRMGVDFSSMLFDTWGGLQGDGNDVVKAIFARCIASLLPGARPAAVLNLRQASACN